MGTLRKIITDVELNQHNSDIHAHPYLTSNLKNFKNLIINGDFQIWQRGTIHVIHREGKYTADRFYSETKGLSVITKGLINFGEKANTLDVFGDGSCIAAYTFDGNANDLGGHYNGTWVGAEQYDTGIFGQAARFDETNYIRIDTNFGLTNQGTISMWVYWDSESSVPHDSLFGFYNTEAAEGSQENVFNFFLRVAETNAPRLYINGTYYDNVPIVTSNHWRHVVFTFDGVMTKIYIDGVMEGVIYDSPDLSSATTFILGADYDYSGSIGDYMKGLIDQVRIFNRALSDYEVQILMFETIPRPLEGLQYRVLEITNYTTEYVKPIVYRFEGQHLYPYKLKNSKLTLSFDFISTKSGIYAVALINKTDPHDIKSQIRTFEYNTPNELRRISVTFDLSQFGNTPVRNDNKLGFELVICGMTDIPQYRVSTEGTYVGEKFSIAGGVRLEPGDKIYINRIQLEESEYATEFEEIPYEIQLLRCLRYYYQHNKPVYALRYVASNDTHFINYYLPTIMRVAPTVKYRLTKPDEMEEIKVYSDPDIVQIWIRTTTNISAGAFSFRADAEL